MITVLYLSLRKETPASGYWDQYIIEQILDCEAIFYENVHDIPEDVTEILVVIPGAYQAECIENINGILARFLKVSVIITSDEENKFPIDDLKHPNMTLYSMYPHTKSAYDRINWLPIGAPPQIDEAYKIYDTKNLDVFFSGQVNHESRKELVQAIQSVAGSWEVYPTEGFAQGLPHDEYYQKMSKAKVAPAPRGNISPDSFRLYEALELGAVPIAENVEFFNNLFGAYPFPVVSNNEQWKGYIEDAISNYPKLNNRCQAWWLKRKYDYKKQLTANIKNKRWYDTSVIVPVSPVSSNPYTDIFEKTYESIRHHYSRAPLYITFDGVRPEQESMRAAYEEHIRRVLWLIRNDNQAIPLIFDNHLHQVGMMREVLPLIDTPAILYIEHDCPLVTDYSIEWDYLVEMIITGVSNLIRFHFEAQIPTEHKSLMFGTPEKDLQKTMQWSQRPHLASTAFYQRILSTYFSPDANCFIEDRMYGVVMEDCLNYNLQGWQQWRLHIYHPKGVIKRSYTLDGRAGGHKFDDIQKW